MSADDYAWPGAPNSDQPPPGKYVVSYVRGRVVWRFDRRVAELDFSIIEPVEWEKWVVTMYCSLPLDGPASPRSKYYEVWTLANGGRPKRRDRMTPHVFSGYWIAEVGETRRATTRDGIRELAQDERGMAVVLSLIERAAGAPEMTTRVGNRAPHKAKVSPKDEMR